MRPLFSLIVYKTYRLPQPRSFWQHHVSLTKSCIKYLRLYLIAGVTDISQKGRVFADARRLQLPRAAGCCVRYLVAWRTRAIHAHGIWRLSAKCKRRRVWFQRLVFWSPCDFNQQVMPFCGLINLALIATTSILVVVVVKVWESKGCNYQGYFEL